MDNKEIYQKIYENYSHYGNSKVDRCPGVRLFKYYKQFLESPIIDLGCGRGDTVFLLRKNNFEADGIDIVDLNNNMLIGDITQDIELSKTYNTALCIDVIEHVEDRHTNKLFNNFKKTKIQIFSIHNGSSAEYYNTELHINRKPFEEWENIIKENFDIIKIFPIHKKRKLYITKTKA